jgi:hypothetical protein
MARAAALGKAQLFLGIDLGTETSFSEGAAVAPVVSVKMRTLVFG